MSKDPLTKIAEIIILLVICTAVGYGVIWCVAQFLTLIFRWLGVA